MSVAYDPMARRYHSDCDDFHRPDDPCEDTMSKQATEPEALREALRTVDMLGFGADVDADSIVEKAARERLDGIAPDEYALEPGRTNQPTAEVIADEEDPSAWHINVSLALTKPGTKVFVSVAELDGGDNRYTDLAVENDTVTLFCASNR